MAFPWVIIRKNKIIFLFKEVIMARPRTGRTTQNLSISLDKELIEKLIKMAIKENRKKSNMAATLIREAIEKREK